MLDRAAHRALGLREWGAFWPRPAYRTTARDLGLYARRLQVAPESVFGELQKPADVGLAQLGQKEGMELLQVAFPSPCQPVHPEFVAPFESMPENHICYARWARPSIQQGPTCVLLHDWGERSLGPAVRHCGVSLLVGHGLSVVVPLLPHHGPRKPGSARFSGEPFLCGDVVGTAEAHLQAVRETRALLRWLRDRGAEPLGVIGFGLGALIAALVCGLERDLDFGLLLYAPSRLAGLLAENPSPLLRGVHGDLRAQGLLSILEEVWRPLDAAVLGLALPSARVRILGARGDGLVPAAEVERLARATGASLQWLAGGHGPPSGLLRDRTLPWQLLRALREVGALRAG
jgi:dienelactone hydrolase